ncbi:MAG: hypothetical protein WCT37_04230 [Patescibacteria group bacterium]|jgi:hypothetical protein
MNIRESEAFKKALELCKQGQRDLLIMVRVLLDIPVGKDLPVLSEALLFGNHSRKTIFLQTLFGWLHFVGPGIVLFERMSAHRIEGMVERTASNFFSVIPFAPFDGPDDITINVSDPEDQNPRSSWTKQGTKVIYPATLSGYGMTIGIPAEQWQELSRLLNEFLS